MEPREAAELLALMRGTWPRLAGDEVANQLWLDDLVQLDRKPALEAFRSLRNSQERAPAWALFREAYGAQARRFEPRRYELEAPDVPPPTEEAKQRVHELVDDLKAMLKAKKQDLDRHTKAVWRPAETMDPLEVRAFSYDEVYDENGEPRFPFGDDGWPVAKSGAESRTNQKGKT